MDGQQEWNKVRSQISKNLNPLQPKDRFAINDVIMKNYLETYEENPDDLYDGIQYAWCLCQSGRWNDAIEFLLDLFGNRGVVRLDALFVVLCKLITDHLSESGKDDEEHNESHDCGQAHAHRGILLFFVERHLFLLQSLLVVGISCLQGFQLRFHAFHGLVVSSRNDLLPNIERRKDKTQYNRKQNDRPAETRNAAAEGIVDSYHELCHEVSGFADVFARNAIRVVAVARNQNAAQNREQRRDEINLQFPFARITQINHLVFPR